MTEEIIKQLVSYGGGTAIIVALVFLFKEIAPLIRKDSNNKSQDLEKRIRHIEGNDLHYLRGRIDITDDRIDKIENRLTRIETILDSMQRKD